MLQSHASGSLGAGRTLPNRKTVQERIGGRPWRAALGYLFRFRNRGIRVMIGAVALVAGAIFPTRSSADLSLSSGGATVYDTVNKLTWLADANFAASNRFGLPLCNGSNSATQPCVNQSGSMRYESATAWVAAMNAANYLGHNNWQLPTTPLVDKSCPKTGPNGGSFGFGCAASALGSLYLALGLKSPTTAVPILNSPVGPFSNFQPYLYWSQTNAGGGNGNSTFSFATGWQGANTQPNFLYLLPMIPGKIPGTPAATGMGLQANPGGQTVYDPMTNITWVANANLAASNTFGLPRCTDAVTPTICVAQDGAMSWDSASQYLANMNSAAYLGQTNWTAPSIDPTCPGYNCTGTKNPMGNLFYSQLGFIQGSSIIAVPNIAVGAFHNFQPYLYWTCQAATIQSPCQADGPAPNFAWSFSFGSGFQGTDLLANNLYVTAYYVGSAPVASPPILPANSVVNNASFAPGSNALAPGTIAAIFGSNLDDGTSNASSSFGSNGRLLTTLGGASVTFNGISAPIFSAFPGQLNVEIPQELAGQTSATVKITVGGISSAPQTVPIAAFSPGIFTIPSGGTGQGAIQISNTTTFAAPQASITGAQASPVNPGQSITIYCTGLGAVTNSPATGAPASSNPLSATITSPQVNIGGVPAKVSFSGLAPGFVGLYQVNAEVPAGVPSGGAVPVALAIGGVTANTVRIAIAAGGSAGAPYAIKSISICSASGTGGAGSCPSGTFDTQQIVLAPDGSGNAINRYEAPATSDEHSSVFPPGSLGANNDYLFFVASGTNLSTGIGTAVLSGGAGPDKNGQWTFDIPKADGYGSYPSGYGQVFRQPFPETQCPTVADGNPAHQDQTFDLSYAAPGSVVKDPTGPPGSLLMIYEGVNACIGSTGGAKPGQGPGANDAYITTGIATSLDYGKNWATYRGTPTFAFTPMPGANRTQAPNAPSGAVGTNVCMGNDCTTPPPAAYGRYPVLMPTTSLASLMAAGQPITGTLGDSQVSAFLDDVSSSSAPYVYIVHNNQPGGDLAIARGQLSGGAAPLSFFKWNGQSFSTPGIGGAQAQVFPSGSFQSCGGVTQNRSGGSLSYVEETQQYLFWFTCVSPSDPAKGPGTGNRGAAWFYSTSSNLSDPTSWSTPQEVVGSWEEIDNSGGCPSYKGWYPTLMSLGAKPGHLSNSGYVFYLWGCETGAGDPTALKRQFSSRAFTIATN